MFLGVSTFKSFNDVTQKSKGPFDSRIQKIGSLEKLGKVQDVSLRTKKDCQTPLGGIVSLAPTPKPQLTVMGICIPSLLPTIT